MRTATSLRRRRVVVASLLVGLSVGGFGAASAQVQAPAPAPAPATADEPEQTAPFFGDGNIPEQCAGDMSPTLPDGSDNPQYWLAPGSEAVCHHMRSDMNGLDSPQVDVLILVPASPAAERDMRIMRQSVQMWEGGIDDLATKMGLDWLEQGMDFHITVDTFDPNGAGGEFTTYPIVDPEIVVLATNPVGGIGIGIDPVDFFGVGGGQGPCTGIPNAADIDAWEALPGFEKNHEARGGTYREDCEGRGGNVCFAVNGAIDPTPGEGPLEDFFSLFDLVSHEVGHCLTVGHVGDGAEGDWGGLPTNDIMAYASDPPGLNKCVSTLNVTGIATVMSRYLDVNGDGAVTEADRLLANDQAGDGGNPFVVQRPEDHFYASTTGSPLDCPQPDLGLLPGGAQTEWNPADAEQPSSEPAPAPASPAKGKAKRS